MHDNNSLAHTSWNCKYHIVFAPKYRRKIFYGQNKAEIGKILRELCEWKGVHIVEAEVCPDHIHMLVEIPPKMSVSGFMGFLKGKSSIIIHQRHGNLKYKYGNRSFWCRGYYVDTAGKNAKRMHMISTWFLFCTFFSNISITKSIIPYLNQKAQLSLSFFDKLKARFYRAFLLFYGTKNVVRRVRYAREFVGGLQQIREI